MARRGGNPRVSIKADQNVDKTVGDAQRSLGKLEKSADRSTNKLRGFATASSKGFRGVGVAATGMTAGVGAAAVGIGYLTKQFIDSEKVAKQTNAVLKSTHSAAGVTAKQVSALANAISRKTGIDDEAIQSGENLLLTFTKIHNETGKGNKIFDRATRTITDMSVALGQDTKSSAIQLGKALNDPIKGVTALQRVGVSFTQSQKDQIKTLVDSGKTLDAQKLILRELNREFGGSAKAAATPFDKLKVSAGNLAETAGSVLAPALGKAAGFANRFLNQIQDGTGAGGRFVTVLKGVVTTLKGAWKSAVEAIIGFARRNRQDIQSVVDAFKNLGRFAKNVFEDVLVPVVKRVIPIIKGILGGLVITIRGLVRLVTGIINGDWAQAWGGAKDIVRGALKAVFSIIKGVGGALKDAMFALAKLLIRGLVAGLKALPGAIKDAVVAGVKGGVNLAKHAIGSVISAINPFGDGIGKIAKNIGDGIGGTLASPGGSVSLMGADPDLLPFAAAASRFGLHTSSGLRVGAITSSGNVSYHSSGDAIDEAGPPGAMLSFFRFMRSRFGPRLRELIYTPGGVGIKDGRPFRYTGQVAADHYDHVHVAYTGPFGDGHGRRARTGDGPGPGGFVSTAYGPPWGGIQGGGVTATGVDLRPAKHAFGIAVDPSRLKLGRNYYVWPNPFGRKGPFRAFDTGGAIKGNRIDFYDWRGRASQLGWGVRRVTVSDDPSLNYSGGGPQKGKNKKRGSLVGKFTPGGGKGGKPGLGDASLERIDYAAAMAALTPDARDDIAAADARVAYWRFRLRQAAKTRGLADDTTAATELKSAIDARAGFNTTDTSGADRAASLLEVMGQVAANQQKLIALATTQGPQVVGAVVAAVNGGIGGSVGLGFSGIRSAPGSVAGL